MLKNIQCNGRKGELLDSTVTQNLRGRPLDIQGGGARKNFEINKFLLKNGEINKFLLNSGEKNICSQAPCISSVTQNIGRNILA